MTEESFTHRPPCWELDDDWWTEARQRGALAREQRLREREQVTE
ncbi:hypothetical protein ACFQ6V_12275 [Streptomyces roseifaciens]